MQSPTPQQRADHSNSQGMAFMEQKEATFMHSSLIEGVHYEHLSTVLPGDAYALGGSLSYLGYGDIAGYNDAGDPTAGSGGS